MISSTPRQSMAIIRVRRRMHATTGRPQRRAPPPGKAGGGHAAAIRALRPDRRVAAGPAGWHWSPPAPADARSADDQPGRPRVPAPGLAQGARALGLSGARPASGLAVPSVRAAVGRPERPPGRAALVPQQDQKRRRRARSTPGRDPRRHDHARPCRLLPRCGRDRRRGPGGDRDARSAAAAGARGPVRRRLPGRARDRPQPVFQRLADGAAAPFPRLSRGSPGASRARSPGRVRRAARRSGAMARVRAFGPARARGPARCAGTARPDRRGRGAPGSDRPAVRSRGPGLGAAARRLAGGQRSAGRRARCPTGRWRRSLAGRSRRPARPSPPGPHPAAPRSP